MPIKSFRGKLADGSQETIILHTNTGSTGYRIKKFQVMAIDSSQDIESAMKIYKISQSTINDDVDFSDNTLLAAAIISQSASSSKYKFHNSIIFDNEVFNQDIYVTLGGADYNASLNYHIELEQVKLDLNENTVATLKDIRNIASQ